ASINKVLVTDQDFANAEADVKFLKSVETRLVEAKTVALQQIQPIYDAFNLIDETGSGARQTRLEVEKLVDAQKKNLRNEIQLTAQQDLADFLAAQNATLAPLALPKFQSDIAGAMKGKKTIS